MTVGYDDTNVIAFYLNEKSEWKAKTFNSFGGYDALIQRTVNIDDGIKSNLILLDGDYNVAMNMFKSLNARMFLICDSTTLKTTQNWSSNILK
jgi:hypothetical protein